MTSYDIDYKSINRTRKSLLILIDKDMSYAKKNSTTTINGNSMKEYSNSYSSFVINLPKEKFISFLPPENNSKPCKKKKVHLNLQKSQQDENMINIQFGFLNQNVLKRVINGFLYLRNLAYDIIRSEKISECIDELVLSPKIKFKKLDPANTKNSFNKMRIKRFNESNTKIRNLKEMLFLKENTDIEEFRKKKMRTQIFSSNILNLYNPLKKNSFIKHQSTGSIKQTDSKNNNSKQAFYNLDTESSLFS